MLWNNPSEVAVRATAPAARAGPEGLHSQPVFHNTREEELPTVTLPRQRIAILGGGPGGYEAALVAAQLGADVTVVDSDGLGGACVLTDCVPSKSLIETSNAMTLLNRSPGLGIASGGLHTVNAVRLYERITDLAKIGGAGRGREYASFGLSRHLSGGRAGQCEQSRLCHS